jgi:hypothetical protein
LWDADAVNFFDRHQPPPDPAEELPAQPPRPAWMKPETTVGGVVDAMPVLARRPDAAIAIGGLAAYPNGFSFTLVVVLRREDRRNQLLHHAFHRDYGEPPAPEFFRLGVRFADGGTATNLGNWPPFGDEPTAPMLSTEGGGGGGRRYDMTYWVWPLPPPGPVTFVCEWPAGGIAESRVEIDGQLILDAAGRAVELWPEAEEAS